MSALRLKKEYEEGTLPDLVLTDLLCVLAVLHPYLYTRLKWTARHVLYLTQHSHFGISRHKEQSWIVSSIPNQPQSLQRQWKHGCLHFFPESSSVWFPLVQNSHGGRSQARAVRFLGRFLSEGSSQWLLSLKDVYVATKRIIFPFASLMCPCSSAKSLWGKNVNTEDILSWHDSFSSSPNLTSFSHYLVHLLQALENEKIPVLTLQAD